MKKFYFYDSDWFYGGNGNIKYHIQGAEFRKLLEVCFQYCSYIAFSFSTKSEERYQKLLSPFDVAVPETISKDTYPQALEVYRTERTKEGRISRRLVSVYNVRFYRTCHELFDVLCSITDSLFTWLDGWGYCNPENPTFYREDGSVFFASTIHEGECFLAPRDDEDISSIISNSLWMEREDTSIQSE